MGGPRLSGCGPCDNLSPPTSILKWLSTEQDVRPFLQELLATYAYEMLVYTFKYIYDPNSKIQVKQLV